MAIPNKLYILRWQWWDNGANYTINTDINLLKQIEKKINKDKEGIPSNAHMIIEEWINGENTKELVKRKGEKRWSTIWEKK